MIWQHPLKNAHKLLKSETWVCQPPYSNTGAVPCQCGFCHANGTTYIKRGPLMSLEMRNNFAWTANRCKPLWALLFSTHWEALLSWGRCPPANEERAPKVCHTDTHIRTSRPQPLIWAIHPPPCPMKYACKLPLMGPQMQARLRLSGWCMQGEQMDDPSYDSGLVLGSFFPGIEYLHAKSLS